jgi:hypothetical protein
VAEEQLMHIAFKQFSILQWLNLYKGSFQEYKTFDQTYKRPKSKWVINLFINLVFIKLSVLKHHSFSIELMICTTAISTNLIYSDILCVTIWEDVNYLHNYVKGLQVQGLAITTLELFFVVKTNREYCRSRLQNPTHVESIPQQN